MKISMEERFWRHVDKNGPVVRPELGECWLWTGSLQGKGYGSFWDGNKLRKASQVAWEIERGEKFPLGGHACHHCDNKICVRWSHIYVGNNFTNQQDRVRRGRHNFASLTHCLKGHPFSGDNLVMRDGRRRCRICLRIRDARHTAKMNAKGYWKSGQSHGWILRKSEV